MHVTSSLCDGEHPCPGQTIIYTCTVIGSEAIRWFSNEYIDPNGNPIEFAAYHEKGSVQHGLGTTTVAILVNSSNEGGLPIMEVRLEIVTSPKFQNFSVVCEHANGSRVTLLSRLLGK